MRAHSLAAEEEADLSQGIKSIVVLLNENGWEISDSGDGSSYEAGMECAIPEPMVVVVVGRPIELGSTCDGLFRFLGAKLPGNKITIQGNYSPNDGISSILLTGDGLLNYEAGNA